MKAALTQLARIILVAVLVASALFWLRKTNQGLARQVAELPRQRERNERLRADNARVKSLLAIAQEKGRDAVSQQPLLEEIEQLRAEATTLGKEAEERRAKRLIAEVKLANNRDPVQGPVKMENFKDRGRATPLAGFETLVSAAMGGDDEAVARMLALDGRARERAAALIATLPRDQQEKFSTPEALAALFFENMITGHYSAQVLSQRTLDTEHAEVTVAFNGRDKGESLSMQWSESGWKMLVKEKHVSEIQKHINTVAAGRRGP